MSAPTCDALRMETAEPTAAITMSVKVQGWLVGASLLILFFGCFVLYTRNNDFPAHYHEDETTKADQVASNTRNFNHPLLMLEATQLAAEAMGTPKDIQSTVRVGRSVSAAFAALSVCALALIEYRIGGWIGLSLAGLAVGLCPALVVYSHYMKEDPALLAGVSLTLLASRIAWERRWERTRWPFVLLGVSCGLAASGKYVGVFALAMAVPFVLSTSPSWRRSVTRTGLLLLAFMATVAIVNHRALKELPTLGRRIQSEREHATTQHRDLTMSRPTLYHAVSFARQSMPHIWLLAGLFVATTLARPSGKGWNFFLIVFGVVYLFVISWSVLPFHRYVLPVVMIAHFAAALSVVGVRDRFSNGAVRRAIPWVAAAVFIGFQAPRCVDFTRQFGDDSRERLRTWIAANLPNDAVLVQDDYIALDQSAKSQSAYVPRIYGVGSGPEMGDLSRLRRLGVDYVAVSDIHYGPYFDPHFRPAAGTQSMYDYNRRWYESLFRDNELVWASEPAHPTYSTYNNLAIRLYRLRH